MWQLQGNLAQLTLASLELQIPIQTPWLGCSLSRVLQSQNVTQMQLLQPHLQTQIQQENSVQEAYIRGNDLVITYAPVPNITEPIYWQIYYRVWNNASLPVSGLEIILSAHTAALHSQPAMQLVTQLGDDIASDELLSRNVAGTNSAGSIQPRVILYRPKQAAFSYLEMVHPSDFTSVHLHKGDVTWQLFPESLEKGVIRRARACGLFLPRNNDEWQIIDKTMQEFINSPPILTT